MRIAERSADSLVIAQSPWSARVFGLVFGALGFGILALIHGRKDPGVWVGYVVGAMFAIAGLAMLFTAAGYEIRFDRAEHCVRIRRRWLFRGSTKELALTDIQDVAAEQTVSLQQVGRNNGPTYRVVFLMQDGTRVPWTMATTGYLQGQARCIEAAREFGGWHALPAGPSLGARPIPTLKNLGCALLILGLFASVGLGMVGSEMLRLYTWHPVSAVVLSHDVAPMNGSRGNTSYRPFVTYQYTVNGQMYTANTVHVIALFMGYQWAKGISDRYAPGQTVTAYVNPSNATHAYLIHELQFFPWIFVLFPLTIGVVLVVVSKRNGGNPEVAAQIPIIAAA